jgi:hypothetical protein
MADAARSRTATSRRAPRMKARSATSLDLGALEDLPYAELKEHWEVLFGNPPPTHISRKLILRAVAYRVQADVYGGLPARTRKQLDRMASDLSAGRPLKAPSYKVKPGTRLLREWQGVVHEVVVLESSVLYQGKSWPSLTAVAREITGARWSGPRFFGLQGRANGRRS